MIHTIDDLFHAVRALTEELNELERLRNQVRAAEAIANVGKIMVERRSTMTSRSENRGRSTRQRRAPSSGRYTVWRLSLSSSQGLSALSTRGTDQANLVDDRPTMIMARGNAAAVVAKMATATIPIVFTSGFDPIQIGLVASFNRPEGNITGVYTFTVEMPIKSLELLHELVPAAPGIGLLINPTSRNLSESVVVKDMEAAARPLGKQIPVQSPHARC